MPSQGRLPPQVWLPMFLDGGCHPVWGDFASVGVSRWSNGDHSDSWMVTAIRSGATLPVLAPVDGLTATILILGW